MFEDAIYFQSERNKENLGSNLLIGLIWTDVFQKYFCRLFCQFPPPPKLHENERNWTERGRRVSGAPLDPSMNTEVTYYHVHPEKLRFRLRIPPQIEKKNTVDMLTDSILRKCKYLHFIYRFFILFISKRV